MILEGTSLADAVLLADLIRTTLQACRIEFPDGVVLSATVSAGVSVIDPTEPSAESLLKAADVGLFMAKRAGRNRVVAA